MDTGELKQLLTLLQRELNILSQREARYGGAAPLDLLNQIQDYVVAVQAVRACLQGELPFTDLQETLAPLLLSVKVRQRVYADAFVLHPGEHGVVALRTEQRPQPQPQPRPRPVLLRPRRPADILDRIAETKLAQENTAALEFHGPPGIGKTTLLRHLAHNLDESQYPDGVIYQSVRHEPAEDIIHAVFEAFFSSPLPYKPSDTEYQHHLQNIRALILLDDIGLERDEVESLLDMIPNAVFVFAATDRHLYGLGKAHAIGGLPPEDAVKLAAQELGRPLDDVEQQAIERVCQNLKGHPLQILELISSNNVTLLAAAPPSLTTDQRKIMSALGAFGGIALPLKHLQALTQIANPDSVVEGLHNKHLLEYLGMGRYQLTASTNSAVQTWPDLAQTSEQACQYFTNWAQENQDSLSSMLGEADTLQQAIRWAASTERWAEVVELVRFVEPSLMLGRQWGAWIHTLHAGFQAARALDDMAAKAWVWHQVGTHALAQSNLDRARDYLNRALQLREQLGDAVGVLITRHNLDLTNPPVAPPPQSPAPAQSTLPDIIKTALVVTPVLFLTVVAIILGTFYLMMPPAPPVTIVAQATPVTLPSPTPTATAPPVSDTPASPTDTPPPAITETPTATLNPTETPVPTSTPTGMPAPVGQLFPNIVDFGTVMVGNQASASVTLSNAGQSSILLEAAFINSDATAEETFRLVSDDCPGSLGPGADCTFNVAFVPAAAGSFAAELIVTSTLPDSPQAVTLTGAATAPTPQLQFSQRRYSLSEPLDNGLETTLSIPVVLDPPSSRTVTVDFATQDETATAKLDYVPMQGQLTFDPTQTEALIELRVAFDTLNEPDETLRVSLANPVNATLAAPDEPGGGYASITIVDATAEPRVGFCNPKAQRVAEDAGPVEITVCLEAPGSASEMTVTYTTIDQTATATEDYIAVSGKITFPPGSTGPLGFKMPIIDDKLVETVNETILLFIESSSNSNNFQTNSLVIVDNDTIN